MIEMLPNLEEIKRIVKILADNEFNLAKLKLLDDFLDTFNVTTFKLFSYKKSKSSQFTIQGNLKLKRIRVNKDDKNLDENDLLRVYGELENNFEAFYELVSKTYLGRPSKVASHDYQLLYIRIPSRFCSEKINIYFVRKNYDFYIVFEELTDIRLTEYLVDFVGKFDEQFHNELNLIASDNLSSYVTIQKKLTELFESSSNFILDSHGFIQGAITFFDFLGWKGLWQSKNSEPLKEISDLIENIRDELNIETRKLLARFNEIQLSSLISISDTIAIFTPKVSNISEMSLLNLHSKISKYILEQSTKKGFPIRGAIAFGEYNKMNNIMIGPGIDECASWYEKCDWIGAHFTPSAQFIISKEIDKYKPEYIISTDRSKCKPPVKRDVPPINYCVRWSISKADFDYLTSKVKSILPEIAGKYLNTYNFLNENYWEEENGKNEVS